MDKTLLMAKHLEVYLSTLQIGAGVLFVPEHLQLHIHLIVLEIVISI